MEEHGSLFNLIYHLPGSHAIGLTPERVPPFVVGAWFVVLVFAVFCVIASRHYSVDKPGRLQTFLEMVVEWLEHLCEQGIGEGGARYAPFVGTVFLFLVAMNLLGELPGLMTPTTNLNITLGMALIVFLATPYFGIKAVGARAYFKDLLGEPRWLSWFLFPLNIVEEFVRPISLSIRLFGNMFADHTMGHIMALLTFSVPVILSLAVYSFFQVLSLFSVFVAFVQAFVFAALAIAYIAGAVAVHQHE